jgi:hypothetical protein
MDYDFDLRPDVTDHSSYRVKLPETGIEADITVSTVHNQDNLGAEEFQEIGYHFDTDITDEIESFCEEKAPFGDYSVFPLTGRYEGDSSMSARMPINDQNTDFPGLEAKREGEKILKKLDEYLSEIR